MDGGGVVPTHNGLRFVPGGAATQRPGLPRELAPLRPNGGPPLGPTTPPTPTLGGRRAVHTPKESRKRIDFWPIGASYCRTPESENAGDPERDHFHDLRFLVGPANRLDREALRHRGGLVNEPVVLNGHALHVQRNPETRERAVRVGDLVVWRDSFAVIADIQRGDQVERMQFLLSEDLFGRDDGQLFPGYILDEIFRLNGGSLIAYLDDPVWLGGIVVGIDGGAGAEASGEQATIQNTRWAARDGTTGADLVCVYSPSERRHDVHRGLLVGLKLVRGGAAGVVSTDSDEQLRLGSWSFAELLDQLAFTVAGATMVSESSWLASSVWGGRDIDGDPDSLGEDGWRQLVHALQVVEEDSRLSSAANLRQQRTQQRVRAAFFDEQWREENRGWIFSNLELVRDVHKFATAYWKRIMIEIEPEQERQDLQLLAMVRNNFDGVRGGWYDPSREVSGRRQGSVMVGGK